MSFFKNTIKLSSVLLFATIFSSFFFTEDALSKEISTTFKKDIQKLLKITDAENMALQTAHSFAAMMINSMRTNNPDFQEKDAQIIIEVITTLYKEKIHELVNMLIPIYTKHFSHAEIKELTAFYDTSIGKKSLKVMPALMQDSMLAGQKFGMSIQEELVARIQAKMK
ncbi:MAG: DUF2059 domain-containing protein [Alphaproteobacteria bacterium]